jgi:hypothetical protein
VEEDARKTQIGDFYRCIRSYGRQLLREKEVTIRETIEPEGLFIKKGFLAAEHNQRITSKKGG